MKDNRNHATMKGTKASELGGKPYLMTTPSHEVRLKQRSHSDGEGCSMSFGGGWGFMNVSTVLENKVAFLNTGSLALHRGWHPRAKKGQHVGYTFDTSHTTWQARRANHFNLLLISRSAIWSSFILHY